MLGEKWKPLLFNKFQGKIREKAIARTKARIALSGRKVTDLSEEEREVIVREEEDGIKDSILKSGMVGLLILLGLS